jgi:hypothetical protein
MPGQHSDLQRADVHTAGAAAPPRSLGKPGPGTDRGPERHQGGTATAGRAQHRVPLAPPLPAIAAVHQGRLLRRHRRGRRDQLAQVLQGSASSAAAAATPGQAQGRPCQGPGPVRRIRHRTGGTRSLRRLRPPDCQVTGHCSPGGRAAVRAGADAVLCTDSSPALSAEARHINVEHHAINVSAGEHARGPWHINNVNGYHIRLKTWLRRFNGVASSYLPSCLEWLRVFERFCPVALAPVALLALAVGV